MSVATKQAIMLFKVKLVWLAVKSMVAAAIAISAVMMSLGARAASVMDPPSSSNNSPSGTVNCRLASPRGPACTSTASLPVALVTDWRPLAAV